MTSHLTHALTILPTTIESDDAVQRLQESLAAASRGGKKTADGSAPVIEVKEDPELAKRQAELAEREKLKADRRRQQLADRDLERGRRIRDRFNAPGGLTVGGLEDDEDTLETRPSAQRSSRKHNRRAYDEEEEEYGRRGRAREDEYDEEDDFLVGSDEEPEIFEDEEGELDEDMDAEGEDDEPAPAKKPSKEDRATSEEGT